MDNHDPVAFENDLIDITTRTLARRQEAKIRLAEGAFITLEYFEFVDREAMSIYWTEVLRKKARG